jgi:hypothetical protein
MTPLPVARQTIKRRPGPPRPEFSAPQPSRRPSCTGLCHLANLGEIRRNALLRLTLRGIPENDGDSSRFVASLIHLFASCREHCD